MSYIKTRIIGCKKASIRRYPWIPLQEKDIVDVKENVNNDLDIVSIGSTLEIDPSVISYSWTGRKFYKVKTPDGWIYEGCVSYKGGDEGG